MCDNQGHDDCTFTPGFARIAHSATVGQAGQLGYLDQ